MVTWLEKMTEAVTMVAEAAHFYNIVLAYVLELIVLFVTMSFRTTVISTSTFLTLIYTVNYFVYQYRGKAFSFRDILAFKTAARVVENYDLTPSNIMVVAWSFFILLLVFSIKADWKLPHKLAKRSKGLLHIGGICIALLITFGAKTVFSNMAFWEQRNILTENGFFGLFYSNGFLVSTCIELAHGGVKAPENYSPETVNALLTQHQKENTTDDLPHIIMIMNESFADLRVWGDLQMSEECLPFFTGLEENTIRGYVNASGLGGGTANSEFEVLTGCTMGFLPSGYYPYQQCITTQTPSMVSVLKNEGYTAYSIHPELSSNWNRKNVYADLGFDKSYWMEDFAEAEIVHAGVSDRAIYERVIDLYENRTNGEKLFFHNVTMQNHGGYTWSNIETTINATNLNYSEIDLYLSLLKNSDEAFAMLVNYFMQQEEKVVICMFGDHQPKFDESLSYDLICAGTEGLTDLDKQMNLYKTPFILWANYDIEEAQGLDISMNYLGALTMEQTGIRSYAYFNYLNELMESWPIVSVNGIFDRTGRYYNFSETRNSLQDYELLQYHQLFGTTK